MFVLAVNRSRICKRWTWITIMTEVKVCFGTYSLCCLAVASQKLINSSNSALVAPVYSSNTSKSVRQFKTLSKSQTKDLTGRRMLSVEMPTQDFHIKYVTLIDVSTVSGWRDHDA